MFWLLFIRPILSLDPEDCQLFYSTTTFQQITIDCLPNNALFLDSTSNISSVSAAFKNVPFSCLIDLTYENFFFPLFDSISSDFSTFYITVSRPEEKSFSSLRYYSHNYLKSEADALNQVIKYLNWNEFILVSCNHKDSLEIGQFIYTQNEQKVYSFLKYTQNILLSSAVLFIRKLIKITGVQRLIIIDKSQSCTTFQTALKENNLIKIGKYFIISCSSPSDIIIEGSITVCEQGLEASTSVHDYEFLSINASISQLSKSPHFHVLSKDYSLLNYKNEKIIKVGEIVNSTLSVTSEIHFPGNTTLINALENSIIPVSISNGTTETQNYGNYYYMSNNYQGAIYAAKKINENKEIPKFEIQLFPTNCGIYFFIESYANKCYTPIINNLGIAYLAPLWDTVAEETLLLLRKFNLNIPQISAMAISDTVDNKTDFPEFLKLTVSTADFFASGFLYQTYMGWLNVVLLATDDPVSLATYNNVLKYSDKLGIKVVNDLKFRILPWQYKRENFSQYEEYFIHAKNTRCRIFYILAWDRGLIWEALYDVGMRKGDFISITENAVIQYLWEDAAPEEFMKKRRELIEGSIIYKYAEWQGDLGLSLKSELEGDLSYRCLTYDSMLVIKESVNYLLAKGNDFEDPNVLINAMRSIKFKGCTGLVYFSSDSNSRGYCIFSFEQLRRNLTSSSKNDWYFVQVANVDKFSQTVVTPVGKYEWQFDTLSIPSNFLPDYECGINPEDKRKSHWGYVVLCCICSSFFLISIPPAMLAGYKFNRKKIMLSQKKQITLADMLYMFFFLVQFLQIMSIGLNFTEFQTIYGEKILILSLDYTYFFKLQFTNYWTLYLIFLVTSALWTLFCIIIVCGHGLEELSNLLQIIISFVGNIFFMSIFSLLLTIYSCTEASGESILDSYLTRDCNIKCYQGDHLKGVVIATVIIIPFLFFTILCRPHWEFYQSSLNLFTTSKFLSVLSVWEVFFVVINKTLQVDFKTAQGFVSFIMIFILILCIIRMNPYNYDRSKILNLCTLTMAAWGLLTGVVFTSLKVSIGVFIGIQITGLGVIFIGGLFFYYRSQELLYNKEPEIKIEEFIKFQFGLDKRDIKYRVEGEVRTRPEVTAGNEDIKH